MAWEAHFRIAESNRRNWEQMTTANGVTEWLERFVEENWELI